MKRRRSLGFLAVGFLILAAVAQAQIRPTEKPFLWRIDGPTPSYLYGTVHVPDARVLELPDVVRRSLDAADAFYAEIPLDAATQMTMMPKIMLPPGQNLKTILGDATFDRLINLVRKIAGGAAPAEILTAMLSPMKPWAVMSQVELLEFLPDITAGRMPLDAMLWSIASNAKKELGALETVDEQVGVFDGFTTEEQVRMLVSALDDLEKPRPNGVSPTQELVALYLSGDLDKLAGEINQQYPTDQALNKKLMTRLLDDRNTKMAAAIAELVAKRPARSHFFAVGAMHYAGDTGLINLLTKRGLKITRLGPADAGSISRKPAA